MAIEVVPVLSHLDFFSLGHSRFCEPIGASNHRYAEWPCWDHHDLQYKGKAYIRFS
jgi:hypothetical protein